MFELAWSKLLEFWGGFLTHASALLPPTNSIAAGISFALIAAVILVPIMSRVGLGTMIGYLLAGIVVGPYGLGLVEEVETIMNFAEFGIVLMMFLIGLELDPKRLWEMKLPVFAGGPLQMILCALPFALLLDLAGMPWPVAVLSGFALAMSSTAVAVQELSSRSMMGQPVGQKAFSILLFQDLASIPLIAAIPVLALTMGSSDSNGAANPGAVDTLIRAAIALIFMVGVGRFLTVPFLRFTIRSGAREMLTAFALLLTVGSAWIMQAAGLSSAMGGFVGGLLLGSSGFRHQLEAEISTFKQLLLGLFFVTVGMSIDMHLVMSEPVKVILALAILLIVKTGMLFVLAFAMRLKGIANKMNFAVSLSQGGEFAFVVFSLAQGQGVLSNSWAAILTVAVACSMGTTPILMQLASTWLQRRARRLDDEEDDREELAAAPDLSVIIAGYGDFGAIVARMLVAMGITPTIIDNDPDRIRQAKHFGTKVYYGDASQLALLKAAGADEAKILVIAVGPGGMTEKIADLAREAFPHLHIIAQVSTIENHLELLAKDIEGYLVNFEPAIEAARSCLVRLNVLSPYEAREIGDIFRRYTVKLIREMVDTGGDIDQAVAAYRSNDETLESVMKQIRTYRRERIAAIRSRSMHLAETPGPMPETGAPSSDEKPAEPAPADPAQEKKQASMREDALAAWPPLEEEKPAVTPPSEPAAEPEKVPASETQPAAPSAEAPAAGTKPQDKSPEETAPASDAAAPKADAPAEDTLDPASAAAKKAQEEALKEIAKEAAKAPPPNPEELPVSDYFRIYKGDTETPAPKENGKA